MLSIILVAALIVEVKGQWTEILSGIGRASVGPDIRAMAVTSTGVLLVGTAEGIYRSSNNGSFWSLSNVGLTYPIIGSLTTNGTSVFATNQNRPGVLRSSNDGASWVAMNSGLPEVAVRRVVAINGKLFALITDGSLYYSTNNGTSWTQTTPIPYALNDIACTATAIFIGYSYGVLRSTDGGLTWTTVSGVPYVNVLNIYSSDNAVAVGSVVGKFLSTNSGETWQLTSNTGGYVLIAQIGTTILAHVGNGFQRSNDNGVTWSGIVGGLPNIKQMFGLGSHFFSHR